ncbi:WhiB family transcriptional regulator [Pseudonocardia sp. EV170527-09]|uniref:WhiB family transcriptional regulator n=1 Tax=Pseudonocardia sp. EV170527-09 TaxID=2603411 RepID=UPI0011F18B37|nr:WhiB family transcriptional regulator [Pseudonocardia sp. EV170527-09]KAA1020243.1 WhiB family transcriptional regulator [Pseudonocardia sp. EV170527-09]
MTTSEHWRVDALCARPGTDPELFFPIETAADAPARIAAAKRVCASCPVAAACLADLMRWEDPARRWGVVGGTTAAERDVLYARQRATVALLHTEVVHGPAAGGEAA